MPTWTRYGLQCGETDPSGEGVSGCSHAGRTERKLLVVKNPPYCIGQSDLGMLRTAQGIKRGPAAGRAIAGRTGGFGIDRLSLFCRHSVYFSFLSIERNRLAAPGESPLSGGGKFIDSSPIGGND